MAIAGALFSSVRGGIVPPSIVPESSGVIDLGDFRVTGGGSREAAAAAPELFVYGVHAEVSGNAVLSNGKYAVE